MSGLREHGGRHFAVTRSEPDDVWCLELSEAVSAPASWAGIPNAVTHLPGRNLVIAVVPCEDRTVEPTMCFLRNDEDIEIPYEIMRWFMEMVAEDVQHCRAAMSAADSAVAVPFDGQ